MWGGNVSNTCRLGVERMLCPPHKAGHFGISCCAQILRKCERDQPALPFRLGHFLLLFFCHFCQGRISMSRKKSCQPIDLTYRGTPVLPFQNAALGKSNGFPQVRLYNMEIRSHEDICKSQHPALPRPRAFSLKMFEQFSNIVLTIIIDL